MRLKKSRVEFIPATGTDVKYRLGEVECNVNGRGLWYVGQSRKYDCVVHVGWYEDDEDDYGCDTMRVFVVPNHYNPDKVGLIYTDEGFLRDIRGFFKALGMPAWSKVDYSEQGMQGNNYVDMEVHSKRAMEWVRREVKS